VGVGVGVGVAKTAPADFTADGLACAKAAVFKPISKTAATTWLIARRPLPFNRISCILVDCRFIAGASLVIVIHFHGTPLGP
jgi:hypothetical protein